MKVKAVSLVGEKSYDDMLDHNNEVIHIHVCTTNQPLKNSRISAKMLLYMIYHVTHFTSLNQIMGHNITQ